MRRHASAILVAASLTLLPSAALAHDEESDFDTIAVIATAAWGVTQLGFLAADGYYASRNRFLPQYGAWTQTILMTGGSVALGVITLGYHDHDHWLGFAVTDFVLSAWFFVHGVLGIMHVGDDEPPPAPPAVALAPMPVPGGGGLALNASW
jgi:hypothetical protein